MTAGSVRARGRHRSLDRRLRRGPASTTSASRRCRRARRSAPVLSAPSAGPSSTCTTTTAGSGRPSTWPGTASARASTATSPSRCPTLVAELRAAFWPHLLPIAREWAARAASPPPWPDDLDDWLELCHAAGQTRPTPLMLRYGPGDWNALHRDLYGELVFPLQVVIGLDEPGVDYTGGEFVVVEQRPRAQSRATAAVIPQGHGLVFTTRDRPVRTKRGWAAAPMRHGVSTVRSGHRHTLGLVFHDAA